MFNKHLNKKILLALSLSLLTFSCASTGLAARHHNATGQNHGPRPNRIETPTVRVNRPAAPGSTSRAATAPTTGTTVQRQRSSGYYTRHSGAPTPSVNRPAGPSRSTTIARRSPGGTVRSIPAPQGGRTMGRAPQGGHTVGRAPAPRPGAHTIHGPGPVRRPLPLGRPHRVYPYPHWRRSNIVFRYGWPRASYWWGCRRGISFGEYLILALMIESIRSANRPTMEALYTEHVNGVSYEVLCSRYDLSWPSLETRARLRYNQMNSYSTGMGIGFWAWNDRIYY